MYVKNIKIYILYMIVYIFFFNLREVGYIDIFVNDINFDFIIYDSLKLIIL